jgi:hypothetical protein
LQRADIEARSCEQLLDYREVARCAFVARGREHKLFAV